MEDDRFDFLAKRLVGGTAPRRALFARAAGTLLTLLGSAGTDADAAPRRK
jgi:hypothetical protein